MSFKNNKIYKRGSALYRLLHFYFTVNWIKTIYFNFKKFPFSVAKKFPVFFYGNVKFQNISGSVKIEGEIRKGMIGFGQSYEINTLEKGIAEIVIAGELVFRGNFQFGKDYFLYVSKNAYCELGHMSSLGGSSKLICTQKIVLGNYARIGSESQIVDTNYHDLIDTKSKKVLLKSAPILIGNYNFVSTRVTVFKGTVTPDHCIIASNSLCTKDYFVLGENVMIGGVPAKLIRENVNRDWEGEKQQLHDYLNCFK